MFGPVFLPPSAPESRHLSFRCDVLDSVIAEEVLNALQPAELELALAAVQELETRDQAIMRQWQMRLERAEYEAALAERRYQEVDPSNRLVASTLERRSSCRACSAHNSEAALHERPLSRLITKVSNLDDQPATSSRSF